MKALPSACAALLLLAVSRLVASDAASPRSGPDPLNPSGAVPNVAQPAPETPAPTTPPVPEPGKKLDPAMDLLPATPGQILPEPTLTPSNPDGASAVPRPPEAIKPKQGKTEAVEQDLVQHIHFRQAKTRALEDPAVQTEWHNSIVAPTDLLRREALTRYYKLLFARMLKSDATIQKLVATEQELQLRRLKQPRLTPTEALDPEESSRRGYLAAPFTSDQF